MFFLFVFNDIPIQAIVFLKVWIYYDFFSLVLYIADVKREQLIKHEIAIWLMVKIHVSYVWFSLDLLRFKFNFLRLFQMGPKVSQPNTPVWCHNDWAAIFDYTVDTGPQKASGLWIHSSSRLILNIDRKHSVNNKALSLIVFKCSKYHTTNIVSKSDTVTELTKKMTLGFPSKAMAVESFLLFPPE